MANAPARPNTVTVKNRDAALMNDVTIGRGPISDIAVDAGTVVVTNFADDSMTVLDAETLVARAGIAVGQPTSAALSGGRAFVAASSASHDALAVIDVESGDVIKEYPLSFTVTAVIASPDGKRIFAGRAGDDGVDIAVIDVTAERVGTIYVATGADVTIDALRLDASGHRLYAAVSDARSSRLIVIDVETGRTRRSLEIGAPIRGLEIGMDSTAYVLTSDLADGGVLYFVDLAANQVTDVLTVAAAPTQLALSADGTRAYVVDYGHVAVVDTDRRAVVTTIKVGARPSAIALTDARLYVADYDGGVSVYAVAPPVSMLYPQFAGSPALASPTVRELAAVGA